MVLSMPHITADGEEKREKLQCVLELVLGDWRALNSYLLQVASTPASIRFLMVLLQTYITPALDCGYRDLECIAG